MEKLPWLFVLCLGFLSILEVESNGGEEIGRKRTRRSSSPSLVTAYVGQNVTVSCSVSGYSRSNALKHGLEGRIIKLGILGGAQIPYTSGFEGRFLIAKANVSEDGRYKCSITKSGYYGRIEVLQTTTKVEFLPFKSNLLTIPQIRTIKKWLIETKTFGSYKACWDTSASMRDGGTTFSEECGFYSHKFDRKITTWWNSITVFKLFDDNRIFGGFTDLPWSRVLGTQSNMTFIFELQTPKKYPMLNDGKIAVCTTSSSDPWPCFGDRELYVDYSRFPYVISRMNSFVFGPSKIFLSKKAQMEVFYKVDT